MKKEKSIYELYKKDVSIIIAVIGFIVILIFSLILMNLDKNNKDSILINILGRQRMLTQMMAKDTGRIYELRTVMESDSYDVNSKQTIENALSDTQKELLSTMGEYEDKINTIKQGYVISQSRTIGFRGVLGKLDEPLKEHEAIWIEFKKAIDIVLRGDKDSQQYLQAIRYINENNENILAYSNQITDIVLKYTNSDNLRIYYSLMALALISLMFLAIYIRKAYKDLFLPISQLLRGASRLGLQGQESSSAVLIETESNTEFHEINSVFSKLESLIQLIENLNKNIPFKDVLEYIFNTFSEYIPYTYIGVALLDDNRKTIKASYGVTGKYHEKLPQRLLGGKSFISQTSLGKIIESGEERIINDLEEHVKDKPVKDYNRALLEEGIRSSITFPLKNNNEVVGIIFFSSNTKNVYKKEHIRFLRTLANSMVLSLEKDILMQDMVISSTLALAKLTEERDNETGEHLNRMKKYSRMIAEFLSKEEKYKDIIDLEYINNIERFAPLHDIGKVAIKDEILLKPGKLSFEEFEIMKTHAVYGAKVLRMAEENLKKHGRSIFKIAIEIVEGHHEKWDGSGYPYSRKGEDIPLSARIVALGDVFDALTSKRPYKEPFSFEHSIDIIKEGSGKHFDPYIVSILMKNIDKLKNKYLEYNGL